MAMTDVPRAARLLVKGVGNTAGAAFIVAFWVLPALVGGWMLLEWLWGLLGG